ncbi:MAG: N-acetylmuramoyl-L-alanine amidase-like protein [Firmicutes bacterium]|nr:N-acetylmuramoyl-L-alanine amidase-like protein [Bacillota bacterium]
MRFRGTAILGRATAQPDQMRAFAQSINRDAPDLAPLYLELGRRLAVRGDLAFAQAIYETDCFREIAAPHNYGGLGNAGREAGGAVFGTPVDGVLSHLQRLFAYATTSPLPGQMRKVDPGFDSVPRGSAPYTGDLSWRWRAEGGYGQAVERILGEMLMEPGAGEPYQITRAYVQGVEQPGGPRGWQGVKGLVIHRMAGPGADAWTTRRYIGDAAGGGPAATHFVVDDTVILHLAQIGAVAHHTPGKNVTHLGIAVCEHNWGTRAWGETYRRLAWLVAYLVRCFQLSITDVTGRFWWEPVRCANDPTHLGWTRAEGRAGGLFDWNEFIADVQGRLAEGYAAAMAAEAVEPGAEPAVEPELVAVVVPESEPEPPLAPEPAPMAVAVAEPSPQPLQGRRPVRPGRQPCRARGHHRKW